MLAARVVPSPRRLYFRATLQEREEEAQDFPVSPSPKAGICQTRAAGPALRMPVKGNEQRTSLAAAAGESGGRSRWDHGLWQPGAVTAFLQGARGGLGTVLGFPLPMLILGCAGHGITSNTSSGGSSIMPSSKMVLIRLLCYPSREKRPQGNPETSKGSNASSERSRLQVAYLRVPTILLYLHYRCTPSLSQRQGPAISTAVGRRCADLKGEIPKKGDTW